jgi:hypothetical protein
MSEDPRAQDKKQAPQKACFPAFKPVFAQQIETEHPRIKKQKGQEVPGENNTSRGFEVQGPFYREQKNLKSGAVISIGPCKKRFIAGGDIVISAFAKPSLDALIPRNTVILERADAYAEVCKKKKQDKNLMILFDQK